MVQRRDNLEKFFRLLGAAGDAFFFDYMRVYDRTKTSLRLSLRYGAYGAVYLPIRDLRMFPRVLRALLHLFLPGCFLC